MQGRMQGMQGCKDRQVRIGKGTRSRYKEIGLGYKVWRYRTEKPGWIQECETFSECYKFLLFVFGSFRVWRVCAVRGVRGVWGYS